MQIKQVTKRISFVVETDDPDYPIYIRYGKNCWANEMGHSEEIIYDSDELEQLFFAYQAKKLPKDS